MPPFQTAHRHAVLACLLARRPPPDPGLYVSGTALPLPSAPTAHGARAPPPSAGPLGGAGHGAGSAVGSWSAPQGQAAAAARQLEPPAAAAAAAALYDAWDGVGFGAGLAAGRASGAGGAGGGGEYRDGGRAAWAGHDMNGRSWGSALLDDPQPHEQHGVGSGAASSALPHAHAFLGDLAAAHHVPTRPPQIITAALSGFNSPRSSISSTGGVHLEGSQQQQQQQQQQSSRQGKLQRLKELRGGRSRCVHACACEMDVSA